VRAPGLLLALLLTGVASAGTESAVDWPRLDTTFLRDLTLTRSFTAGRPTRVQFVPDGKSVLFLRSGPRSDVLSLFELDIESGSTRSLLTPEQILKGAAEKLSAEEKARRERLRMTARGITGFEISPDGTRILISLSPQLYLVRRRDGAVTELPCGQGGPRNRLAAAPPRDRAAIPPIDPRFSPDGRSVSYVLDQDVYVMDLMTMKERPITTGGTAEVSHGLAEFVAQEEMERYAGYWWSPDSKTIAYEEADAREVEQWRVADPADPGQETHAQRYPRPGKKNVRVRLGLTRLESAEGETTWVDWDREQYPYLATVRWSAPGPLSIVVQTRSQQEMRLLSVDAATGKTKTLLTETDPAWLNIDQDAPYWLPNGFLWTSERAGGPQLEWHEPNGKLQRVLVPPAFGYVGNAAFRGSGLKVDAKRGMVYFRGGADPTQVHLFRVPLAGGQPVRLTDEPGVHTATWGPDAALFVRQSSGPRELPMASLHRADGRKIGELPSVAETPPFLPRTEYVSVTADLPATATAPATRAPVHCAVTRPQSFDPKVRYPVLVEVYGGPGFLTVLQSPRSFLLSQWLADQGFIVVSMDGRGTPGRGRDWERAIRGRFDEVPLADQVAGLVALGARYPEMDLTRVGITGWSFGGYMSALAVLRRPDIFKAAVAGAPVTLWEDYDTHYTERYLGLPEENAKGYEASSLLSYAADLRRPLLLIHGTTDDNVFFSHTIKLSDALFRAGREVELLPLSGFTHMVPDPAVRERLEEKIVRFFQKNL
jgi:dipeptidyl-peptidase 4